MVPMGNERKRHGPLATVAGAALLLCSAALTAQHGHPLDGSWSGERSGAEGTSRVLLVLDFNTDQTLSGFLIENGKRMPLSKAELNPAGWAVTLQTAREDGSPVEIQGRIENLGSVTERAIVGTWQEGNQQSDLRIIMN